MSDDKEWHIEIWKKKLQKLIRTAKSQNEEEEMELEEIMRVIASDLEA